VSALNPCCQGRIQGEGVCCGPESTMMAGDMPVSRGPRGCFVLTHLPSLCQRLVNIEGSCLVRVLTIPAAQHTHNTCVL